MKKKILFLASLVLVLLSLENCKPDRQIQKYNPGDPDSLYQGTKYIIQIPFGFPSLTNPYKDSLTEEGIQLGRRLFYDKKISITGQLACASCHLLQHAFADTVALAVNVSGPNKRNAPTIQNLAWAPALFWDGRQPTLAAQAQDAAHNELGLAVKNAIPYLQADTIYTKLFKKAFGRPGTIVEREIYLALQEFMMSAISANSRFDSLQRGQAQYTPEESDAFFNIFIQTKGECFHCHAQGNNLLMANYAEGFTYRNDGLQIASTINDFQDPGRGAITGVNTDYGLFKNPTLRNIAVSGPYMHDGRYKTLQQVINFYSDSLNLTPNADPNIALHMDTANGEHLLTGGMHFSDLQKAELLILLNDMTDTSFLNNPNLKSPF
jgi:cytochrome c peroxidase